MFKEVLKIIPQLDSAALSKMESSLSGRFGTIAKRFGSGLKAIFLGGGLIGAAASFIDKILNPLKEVQSAIDKTLTQADDLSTNAQLFNTSAGKLLKLQQLGVSAGLDPQALNTLLVKYQGALADAQADPNKKSAVRQFAGDKDIAESFFQFIQGLQKMDSVSRNLVEKEVFGEKQILKAADFLQLDFQKQLKALGGPSSDTLTKQVQSIANVKDIVDLNTAQRNIRDISTKSRLINPTTADLMNQAENERIKRENQNLSNYESLKNIDIAMEEMKGSVVNVFNKVSEIAVGVGVMVGAIKTLTGTKIARGVFESIFGKGPK